MVQFSSELYLVCLLHTCTSVFLRYFRLHCRLCTFVLCIYYVNQYHVYCLLMNFMRAQNFFASWSVWLWTIIILLTVLLDAFLITLIQVVFCIRCYCPSCSTEPFIICDLEFSHWYSFYVVGILRPASLLSDTLYLRFKNNFSYVLKYPVTANTDTLPWDRRWG